MIHYGLFGMEFTPEGIELAPTLPSEWGGVSLSGLHYRDAVLDLRLTGSGRRVAKFTIDGKSSRKALIPCGLTGKHTVEVVLAPG